MTPYLQDADFTLHNGDALEVLRELPDESVQMCVTSPPFFGLRDYGTGTWEGGDAGCDHSDAVLASHNGWDGNNKNPDGSPRTSRHAGTTQRLADECKCGARRVDRQIGLEQTPEEWVASLVAVFEQVRRVLRKDGTLWVECGDSYGANQGAGFNVNGRGKAESLAARSSLTLPDRPKGIKPKDLIGQPFLLAFALRDAGWCWRNCNVWSKPNPMPESVTDRFTVAHSNVLLFSKCTWTGCVEPIYMSQPNSAWLAALVDGEGTISIGATTHGGHQVLLSVCNTNRALLKRIVQVTGMGSVNESKMGTNRMVYRWEVGSRKAASILYRIHPYLIVKQRQAWTALALQETQKRYGGSTKPKAITDRQAALCETIRALNRCEDVAVAPPKARWRVNPYFFDAEAVREAWSDNTHSKGSNSTPKSRLHDDGRTGVRQNRSFDGSIPRSLAPSAQRQEPQTETLDGSEGEAACGPDGRRQTAVKAGANSIQHRDGERWPGTGRNARSVWTIATEPLPFEHYAAFPQALVERCIKAGTSERGCCPECGAAWVREVEVELTPGGNGGPGGVGRDLVGHRDPMPRMTKSTTTTGWRPSCEHSTSAYFADSPIPCTVLDPFLGSGTTALVARRLGRKCIGIELNERYCGLAAERTKQLSLLGEDLSANERAETR